MLTVRIATPPFKPKDQGPGFMDVMPGIASSYIFTLKPGDKAVSYTHLPSLYASLGIFLPLMAQFTAISGRKIPSEAYSLSLIHIW